MLAAAATADPAEPLPLPRPATEPVDPASRLMTPAGAVVTLRLAQQMLAEFCAKLPGSDRFDALPCYVRCYVMFWWNVATCCGDWCVGWDLVQSCIHETRECFTPLCCPYIPFALRPDI
jgi:hypothetical protein